MREVFWLTGIIGAPDVSILAWCFCSAGVKLNIEENVGDTSPDIKSRVNLSKHTTNNNTLTSELHCVPLT
jgi:hypothetical protein